MGCMASKPDYIESAAGGEKEYLDNYLEGETLGQVRLGKTRASRDRHDNASVHMSVPSHRRNICFLPLICTSVPG